MLSFWNMITETPWWVWVALIYLTQVGIQARKGGIMPIWKLFLLPIILIIWFAFSAFSQFGFKFELTSLWILGFIIGIGVGWLYALKKEIKSDKVNHLIALPSDKVLLPYLLAVFLVKYFFGYKIATNEMIGNLTKWDLVVSGLFAGVLIGRSLNYYFKYLKTSSQNLKR